MVVDEVDCMDYEKTDSEFSYTSSEGADLPVLDDINPEIDSDEDL